MEFGHINDNLRRNSRFAVPKCKVLFIKDVLIDSIEYEYLFYSVINICKTKVKQNTLNYQRILLTGVERTVLRIWRGFKHKKRLYTLGETLKTWLQCRIGVAFNTSFPTQEKSRILGAYLKRSPVVLGEVIRCRDWLLL